MKARDALNATSRVLSIWKRQVSVLPPAGSGAGAGTSSAKRIITVLSLARASARRDRSSGLSTSFGLASSPVPATIMSAGTVTA